MNRDTWFQQLLSTWVGTLEKKALDHIFEKICGVQLLQIGGPSGHDWISAARFSRLFWIDPFFHAQQSKLFIQAHYTELPVRSESMDAVLFLHQFSHTQDVPEILAEVARVLKPNGHCVIVDFNAWSLWRLWQLKTKKCCSPIKVKRYLQKLDFEISGFQTYSFYSPLSLAKKNSRATFCETLGQLFFPKFGAAFIMIATKKVPGMTPLVARPWQQKSVKAGLQPSIRGLSSSNSSRSEG